MSRTPFRRTRRPVTTATATMAAIVLMLTAACSEDSSTAPGTSPPALTQLPRPLSATEQQLVTGGNSFAFPLFRAVDSAAGPDSNIFISPLSASMALGMTTVGAAGTTLDAMRSVLGYADMPVSQMADAYHSLITLLRSLDPAVDVRIANAIWYDRGLSVLPAFVSTAQSDFEAPVKSANLQDPATATAINHWADSSTNGKIPSILDGPLPLSDVMFLANAIYFHGSWREQFDPVQTQDTLFTTRTGATVPVRLMRVETSARVSVTPRYTAVDLPYGRDAYVMTVIVPAAGVSMDSVIIALRNGGWSTLTTALATNSSVAKVQVDLPKFSLTWSDTLNAPLTALGMGIAFSDAADFSNMASGQSLKISTVKQKTFINVDEQGTTAAAVTTVEMVPTAFEIPLSVRADHPFVYVLRERLSGTILFVGAFAHPTS